MKSFSRLLPGTPLFLLFVTTALQAAPFASTVPGISIANTLFRMIEQGWTVRKAFDQEMCAHGYEAGDTKTIEYAKLK